MIQPHMEPTEFESQEEHNRSVADQRGEAITEASSETRGGV